MMSLPFLSQILTLGSSITANYNEVSKLRQVTISKSSQHEVKITNSHPIKLSAFFWRKTTPEKTVSSITVNFTWHRKLEPIYTKIGFCYSVRLTDTNLASCNSVIDNIFPVTSACQIDIILKCRYTHTNATFCIKKALLMVHDIQISPGNNYCIP